MDFENLTFGNSLIVSAISVLIVFLVLVCISYLVDGTAFFANRKNKKKQQSAIESTETNNLPETSAGLANVDTKTAAIVMAAVLAYSRSDAHFVIRKIERRKATLSDWEAAGIQDTLRGPL